jgi:predicted transposase/invertase (TIGR01784 family)
MMLLSPSYLLSSYQSHEAKGRAEGIIEGRAEERMANAISLKANGVPIDIIAKILGLTEDEVARL